MKNIILTFLILLSVSKIYSQGKVEYIVESNRDSFNVTYTNNGGNTEQKKINFKKWTTSFIGSPDKFVSISAQTLSKNANISVKIIYNGKIIEQAKSSGDYVIASASGALKTLSDEEISANSKKMFAKIEQVFPNIYPYNKNFSGRVKVYTNSPILKNPNMVISESIGMAENKNVTILSKHNNGYYKVKSGNITGYLSAIWFK
ncbi:hypothetical protein AUW17_07615 [Tenacibaculum dicentrarchi]|nr:hypothetical protein AUW17_07615 [Tenacibaculum dicentrarchi]